MQNISSLCDPWSVQNISFLSHGLCKKFLLCGIHGLQRTFLLCVIHGLDRTFHLFPYDQGYKSVTRQLQPLIGMQRLGSMVEQPQTTISEGAANQNKLALNDNWRHLSQRVSIRHHNSTANCYLQHYIISLGQRSDYISNEFRQGAY
ncbi:hypothetical protein BsWGS_00148 [Bradybaena similaris]